jgi:cyclopropane fatty-acyl-phospholipid synthase-like methyltransferase
MGYDEDYGCTPHYFGLEPAKILHDHLHLLDATGPVLDLGAGQGRNTFFLAEKGFSMDAVDPSSVAIDAIRAEAKAKGWAVRTTVSPFQRFSPKRLPYSAILLFGLLQILTRESIDMLLGMVRAWTDARSLVFVTAFTTDDPACILARSEGRAVGKNSFEEKDGTVNTYLEPGELKDLFRGFDPIHYWEGRGEVHCHGDGPEQQHANVEAVFTRV